MKFLLYVLLALVVVPLQTTLLHYVDIFGVRPDLGLVALPGVPSQELSRVAGALLAPGPDLQSAMSRLHLSPFRVASTDDYASLLRLAFTVPRQLPGAPVVTAGEVKRMLGEHAATVIDARSRDEYVKGHIPGALSAPYGEVSAQSIGFNASEDSFDFDRGFPNKNATYVFACNGIECWKSYKAATFALRHGYRHVFWFRGGFPAWKAAGFPVATGGGAN